MCGQVLRPGTGRAPTVPLRGPPWSPGLVGVQGFYAHPNNRVTDAWMLATKARTSMGTEARNLTQCSAARVQRVEEARYGCLHVTVRGRLAARYRLGCGMPACEKFMASVGSLCRLRT